MTYRRSGIFRLEGARPASGIGSLRVSVWTWFVPSALFIVVAAAVNLVIDEQPLGLASASISGVLVGLAALVAAWTHRHRDVLLMEVAVPGLLLLAAGVVHGSSQGALHSTMLLAGLPVAWMAFVFGAAGTVSAIVAIVVIAVLPFVASAPWPETHVERWDTVLPAAALVGMAIVTFGAGRLLERARAEVDTRSDALEREVSTTRAILESAHSAVAVFTPSSSPQLSSQALDMCRRAGIPRVDDAVSATAEDTFAGVHVHDADRETPTAPQAQALRRAARGESFSDLVQWVGRGDDRRAMVCRSSRIADEGGVVLGTVFVAWDATELIDSVRVREEFLGTVGHELRTPLTAITGYLELYSDEAEPDPSPGDVLVEAARRQVNALSHRIEDLLQAAVPRRIWTTAVDVVPSVHALVSAHEAEARDGVDLVLHAPDELIVNVNPGAFDEVLRNLLTNALKHTFQGSVTVSLTALESDVSSSGSRGVSLSVEDTGVRMNAREAQRVFDRFYRTEETIRRVLPGLGVGLTVARQLVLAHRGSITVWSAPGEGTRFRVTIPSSMSAPAS